MVAFFPVMILAIYVLKALGFGKRDDSN
jgi:hypothetical protein